MRHNRFAADTIAYPTLTAAAELSRSVNALGGTIRMNDDGLLEVAHPIEHTLQVAALVAAYQAAL